MKTYTLKDLEKILHVDERTLFRYLADGKLEGSKTGGKWLFTEKDIQGFLRVGRKKK
jgi:excisionase family DNA binding protein